MTLVFFGMKHCPYCTQIKRGRVLEAFSRESGIPVQREDLSRGESELSRYLGVLTVPAFVLVGDRGQAIKKTRGLKTAAQLVKWSR